VVVRVRPLNAMELQTSNIEIVDIRDQKSVILLDPLEYNGPEDIFKNRNREQSFVFDYAFDKSTTQVLLTYH
jgi:hypothetical protein